MHSFGATVLTHSPISLQWVSISRLAELRTRTSVSGIFDACRHGSGLIYVRALVKNRCRAGLPSCRVHAHDSDSQY